MIAGQYDYNTSDSAKVIQEDNFSENYRPNEFGQFSKLSEDRQRVLREQSHSNYDGTDSRMNYYLQFQSNIQPSHDSKHSQFQHLQQDHGRLAKEDLMSRRHVNLEDFEDQNELQSKRVFNDDVIHVQASKNLQTGRFPQSNQYPMNIDQYKNNNDQIQNLLMQLQAAPRNNFPSQIQNEQKSYLPQNSQQNQYPQQRNPQMSRGSGPNYEKLNKDNSILEIAKMQNSNGSNTDTYGNQSMIDKDYLANYVQNIPSREFSPLSNFPIPASQLDLLPQNIQIQNVKHQKSERFNNQQEYQHHLNKPAMRQVSEADKENFNQYNLLIQMKEQHPLQHSRTMLDVPQSMLQKAPVMAAAPGLSKTNFYNNNVSDQEHKRKEIMDKFDDIPIKELNKAEAYQQQVNIDSTNIDDEGEALPISEQIEHQNWRVRMRAYKQITELFNNQYSKECIKSTFDQNPNDDDEENTINPFEQYAPLLQKVISDSNLVAQYEGLSTLYTFMRYAPEIKQAIFMVQNYLLEKVQLNKPNLKDITLKILLTIIKRDKSQSLNPELFKRFKNKNLKIACFSMEVATEAIRSQLYCDENSLRQIFKSAQDNVGHTNKDIRDISIELLKEIYKVCSDDANIFTKNLKSLRPIQLKEIKDLLLDITKASSSITLFSKEQSGEGNTPKKAKNKQEIDQQQKQDVSQNQDIIEPIFQQDSSEVDLLLLVPENFTEIPYLSQINAKKKSMELFNGELEKLILNKRFNIINKDYTLIYNVVTHVIFFYIIDVQMIEDSNALVFMEAIKTIEYMTILIGKVIKQQKLRSFIQLLTEKFKETKTATVAAVNKALSTIINKQCIPLTQLVEFMICQLAHSNKNPRVKQLILEKIDTTLLEEQKQLKDDDLQTMFKASKDKIIGFIQKDTNAGVRDAAVSLLTTFKSHLYDNVIVIEAINSLPKYRVSEINKQAQERLASKQKSSSSQKEMRPNSAKSDFELYLNKKDIIGLLRKISQININSLDASQISQVWDEAIEGLGEEGIKQQKPLIIATVHQLLLQIKVNFKDNISILESMIVLLKKIFCIDRTVFIDPQTGLSRELDQSIEIALFSSNLIQNKKQSENLLNVILSAADSPSNFLQSIVRILPSFIYLDSHIELLNFLFKWLALKCDYLLKRGVDFSDFEELRSVGLLFINDKTEQTVKQQIIQILVTFKNQIADKKKQYQDEQPIEKPISEADQKSGLHEASRQPQHLGVQIVEAIDQDFEKGLLLLKQSTQNLSSFDFASKEMVFVKLLQISTIPCQNPLQQYQQAYALKALLWFKEELLGLEETFKLTSPVMVSFAEQVRDNSVELYLLNHWVRELSLRDLIDRVAYATLQDERHFLVLFKWLMNQRLIGNSEEPWAIEDFRKLALLLSKHLKSDLVIEFFIHSVDKFGKNKVRDFMELQLMHFQNDYNNFITWFTSRFKQEEIKLPPIKIQSVEEEEVKVLHHQKQLKKFEDVELRDALASPYPNAIESAPSTARPNNNQQAAPDHSKLYKQLREQRKFTKKHDDEQQSENKYDQIISRLEAQLQNNQKSNDKQGCLNVSRVQDDQIAPVTEFRTEEPATYIRPKTRSSSKGDRNTRYQQHDDPSSLSYQAAQSRLEQSSIKESKYKFQLQTLEEEKRRIENEREQLLNEKNHESREWQKRYDQMMNEHEEVISNLKEANRSYMAQVSENEELKKQIKLMQIQHQQMMDKFAQFEQRLMERTEERKPQKIVSQEKLAMIQDTFTLKQDGIGIKKIQELLLNFTDNQEEKVSEEEIGETLLVYYQSIKSFQQRFNLIKTLHQALDQSEEVLFALPIPNYRALLDFNLKVFAQEKAQIEQQSIRSSISQTQGKVEQNEITIEVQKIVSKLLNSKEFTTSLVTLFEILRLAMPESLSVDLTLTQKQHLKVLLRCISRISKALPSEHPDLIRAFDVLLEMQKIFKRNPPESLREDLPCLEEFDLVYRGLKDIADRMMELQPDKVRVFLQFVENNEKDQNAFIKYMKQVVGIGANKQDEEYEY